MISNENHEVNKVNPNNNNELPIKNKRTTKSKLITTSVLLPSEVLKILQGLSDRESRSLSSYLRLILTQHVCEIVKSQNIDLSDIIDTLNEEEKLSLNTLINIPNFNVNDLRDLKDLRTHKNADILQSNNPKVPLNSTNTTEELTEEDRLKFAKNKPNLKSSTF